MVLHLKLDGQLNLMHTSCLCLYFIRFLLYNGLHNSTFKGIVRVFLVGSYKVHKWGHIKVQTEI